MYMLCAAIIFIFYRSEQPYNMSMITIAMIIVTFSFHSILTSVRVPLYYLNYCHVPWCC